MVLERHVTRKHCSEMSYRFMRCYFIWRWVFNQWYTFCITCYLMSMKVRLFIFYQFQLFLRLFSNSLCQSCDYRLLYQTIFDATVSDIFAINKVKGNGASTSLCGTPLVALLISPFSRTCCILFDRTSANHFGTSIMMSYVFLMFVNFVSVVLSSKKD